jgi:hypothetical protein
MSLLLKAGLTHVMYNSKINEKVTFDVVQWSPTTDVFGPDDD